MALTPSSPTVCHGAGARVEFDLDDGGEIGCDLRITRPDGVSEEFARVAPLDAVHRSRGRKD